MTGFRSVVLAAAVLAGAGAVSTAAVASAAHLNDSQFIAAAHCQGLFDSAALGSANASPINALIKSEGAYRAPEVADRAADARQAAMRSASHASGAVRSEMISERDGACQVWANTGESIAASGR